MNNNNVIPLPVEHDGMRSIQDVNIPDALRKKFHTGIEFVDQVWGGFTPTTVTAFTGSPGAGKTSLALSIASAMAKRGLRCAFNTTEQHPTQVKMIADRLELDGDFLCSDYKDVDSLLQAAVRNEVQFLAIDSLHTIGLWVDTPQGPDMMVDTPKTIAIIVDKITDFARENVAIVFGICHATKQGKIKGPRTIEHDVDIHGHLDYTNAKKDPDLEGVRELLLKKNRYGPSGDAMLVEYDGFEFRKWVRLTEAQRRMKEAEKALGL